MDKQADTEYRNEIIDRDEVLKMARQAGFGLRYEGRGQVSSAPTTTEKLEAFAKLVAEAAASKEREACAKVCEDRYSDHPDLSIASGEAGMCAYHIRARGEA